MEKKPFKFKQLLLSVAVLTLGISGAIALKATATSPFEQKQADKRPVVKVQSIQADDYPVTIIGHGEVRPKETTTLSAFVSGEVVNWHPNFVAGGLVKRGDVLFSIDKDRYQAAVLEAEAAVSQAEAQLISEQAQGKVAKAEAKRLAKQQVTDLYLRKPQLMSAKAQLKSAKAMLRLAKRDLKNCETRAPYDALVIARTIGVGQFVQQGAPVGELYNIETAQILLPIAGFDAPFLPNTLAETQVQLNSTVSKRSVRMGVIKRDLGIIDKDTRMSHLMVEVSDPYSLNSTQPLLKFGEYVEAQFEGKTLTNAIKISQDLVTNGKIWLVNEAETLEQHTLTILRDEDKYVYAESNIAANKKMLLTQPDFPQVGMKVKVSNALGANVAKH